MPTILLVDDEDIFRNRLSKALERRGFDVETASNYIGAVEIIARHKPAFAVVDLKMEGKSGLDVIRTGMRHHPDLRAVVLTGYGSIATATKAIKLGAIGYLTKPAEVEDIIAAFESEDLREMEDDSISAPSLARVEWEHISRVLSDCNNNISQAAKKLGIHRRTLQRKLQKFPPTL
ncbi:MAG: response regulator [Thermodesulfobacteriota bacterium]